MSDRTIHLFSFIRFLCLATLVPSGLRAQASPPPVPGSVNNSASYGTTIAQGSLFVVFGYSLGPAKLVQISSYPLPTVVAGTTVTVKSGSTTFNCPMVYTSDGQVAAILPSTTPAGPATLTVAYNGRTDPGGYSTIQFTVAKSSFGVYTTSSRGVGPGIFTALDNSLKTFAASAKPGEVVTVWGTGLGAISGPDSVVPATFPSFPNVQVWVGGQSAQIIYAGRSGCCAAVDQIAFVVPPVADGCNVPVTVVSGGVSSNTVALPVSAAGETCSDSGPSLPASVLTKALAGQPVKVAAIAIGPAAVGNSAALRQTVAHRLSTALHTRVSEADADRLMRAYAARNTRAIRTAMIKYASRWKALDGRTKTDIIVQLGQTQEGAAALFGSFSKEGLGTAIGSAQIPVAGACVFLAPNYPSGLGSASVGLDAGLSLLLTGAAGSFTMKQTVKGQYHVLFGPSPAGPTIPTGAYTISGSGGKDVGGFSGTITVGGHPAIANKSSLATVDRTQPLTVTWTGGVAGKYVLIGGHTPNAHPNGGYVNGGYVPQANFACVEDGGKGTFTIPNYILSSMSATANAKGVLVISPHPLSNQIAIPGIDLAYFMDGSSDSVNVTFK